MNLTDSITSPDNGETWDFLCPKTDGSCGDNGVGFASTGWPSAKVAKARGRQHFDEHEGLSVAQSLDEFRTEQNLTTEGKAS